jgi:BirA family biotin operon repressor/biotin-[acetyl-CoA-carboxylase] ligase
MEVGKSIAFSILLKPSQEIARLSLLTSAAVFLALQKYTNNLQIKWPNDILLNGKKVSGILLESIYNNKFEAVIVGIGVNVNNDIFSENIINKATSLKNELNREFSLDSIIDDILNNFMVLYKQYENNVHHYLDICRNNSSIIGKNVYLNGKKVKVLGILDNGNLYVDDGESKEEIAYGEVTLENNY